MTELYDFERIDSGTGTCIRNIENIASYAVNLNI